MTGRQRHAIAAAVACIVALLAVAALQVVPARAVAGRRVVRASGSAQLPSTAPVPVATSAPAPPATDAPTTVTTAPAPPPPTTAVRPVTPAPPAAAPAAPRPTTPPAATANPPATVAPKQAHIAIVPALSTLTSSGSPTDYTLIGYRWNPCQVVTVSTSGPDAGTVGSIIVELANITGLHFTMVPSGGVISVGWGTVSGGAIGQTVWRSLGPFLAGGNVTIDTLGLPFLGTVLRHELAHAVGLGHASQPNEIMYPTVGVGSPADYQAGDLAGLHAVGGHC